MAERWRTTVRWARPRRGVLFALVVAFALRLSWVLWVTVEPAQANSDSAQFLGMARQFAAFDTYRLNGHVSAFYPPGYAFLLTPFAWLADHTGWFSLPLAAGLVNVVAGTATVAFGAVLAGRWFGPRERTVAAWVLALAAGPIFLTSAALAETVFTTLVLGALVLVSRIVLDPAPPTTRLLVGLGALVGFTTLVRAPGAVVLLVALVAVRRRAGSWRAAGGAIAPLVLAAVVVLVPWTLRNGIQVGVWTPTATNNAAFLCQGHRDDAIADATELTEEDFRPCFTGTPFAPDPDEAAWYGATVREALGWALTHPAEEARLTWDKTILVLSADRQALPDGQDFGRQETASPDLEHRLQQASLLWHRGVLALGIAAYLLLARGRAAWPLWATASGLIVAVWGGVVLDRFHHTAMAVLAVGAAATLVTMGRWASAGVNTVSESAAEQLEAEPPPPAAEGLAQASRPRRWLSGPAGHPFQPILIALATGAWVCALGFDTFSFVSDTEWVYARGAWLLTGLGVAAALAGAFAALVDLLGIPRGTIAFGTGVRHLLALDAALVAFTVSFLSRNATNFDFHDTAPALALVASVLGLIALGIATWLGGTLTYTYGVRVALDEERQKGFEPTPD